MCGRYVLRTDPSQLAGQLGITQPEMFEQVAENFEPNYNVAPTDQVVAAIERHPRDAEPGSEAVRKLREVRWGLVPSWAKDRKIGQKMFNARIESVTEKASFKRAFMKRRCIIPADGYYEWYKPAGPKPVKQPFFIHDGSGDALALAGLYELWRDPEVEDKEDPAAWLWSATILTTTSVGGLYRIHDRMPVIVPRAHYDAWLDPDYGSGEGEAEALLNLLDAGRDPGLETYAVSTAVNSVKNNGPELVVPVEAE
ncbi:SOS response-associated peptidase [Catenulispora subtropica]|uniref:Abasic site processing protein n=1 Tax=Catenulispora subtropica TaxID=450798 RepID=A0ABP5DSU6_9ACTN